MSAGVKRELRAILLSVVAALDSRPEPRDAWDDLGRRDAELFNARLDWPVLMCRRALHESRQASVGIQAATIHRVEIFWDAMRAASLRGYEVDARTDLGSALVALAEENADTMVAAARCQHDPSEGNLEALRIEAMHAIAIDEQILDLASARLAEQHHRRNGALAYR